MAQITDVFNSLQAEWEINERLIFQTEPGGLLAGLDYDKEGTRKLAGEDNLPLVIPMDVQMFEEIASGANTPVGTVRTIRLKLATARRDGWFRRDPTDTTKKKGHLEWCALIMDAIESTRDGEDTPDILIQDTLKMPIVFRISETETTELAFHSILECELTLLPFCRGERSLLSS